MGKKLNFPFYVAVRCHLGYPVVIASAPLWDGIPFPTVYWLTCPILSKAVGALESEGYQRKLYYHGNDRQFLFSRLYVAGILGKKEKVNFYPNWGHIAGEDPGHIKCLHAHLAVYLVVGVGPGRHVWEKVKGQMLNCNGYGTLCGISSLEEG